MRPTRIALWSLVLLLGLAASACGLQPGESTPEAVSPTAAQPTDVPPTETAPAPTPLSGPVLGLATIESLEVLVEEQSASQVPVRLRGVLPNSCTRVDNIVSERVENDFNLAVLTVQEPGEDCSAETLEFEETVLLDVTGLQAGSYQVVANDRQVSFNLSEREPETEETGVATSPALSISGLVWHDSCANAGLEDEALPPGCILSGNDAFLGDGVLQDEEGIAGVQVAIGEGECPAPQVAAATTDSNGAYSFDELVAATYCLFIDTTDPQNQEVLGDGFWTVPDNEASEITVVLEPGGSQEDVNFAWDFLNLPASDIDIANCTNSFEFVADLSIPDDTAFPAGESFTKEWQLRNNGTCPWSTEYSVAFVGGDQMSANESIALDQVVAPGQDLEVSIDMIAPEQPGTYRGNWQLADADGNLFGINNIIDDAFWLQIVVDENAQPLATPLPNSGALGGVVWDDFCLNSDPGRGCVETPPESGFFVADGTFSASELPLSEIEISLAEGACPAGGVLPPDSAVLERIFTDDSGNYEFPGLSEGTYCVFMDALDEAMVDLLIPGNWTWPGTGVGLYTVVLDPGEQILDLDFGWDYVD